MSELTLNQKWLDFPQNVGFEGKVDVTIECIDKSETVATFVGETPDPIVHTTNRNNTVCKVEYEQNNSFVETESTCTETVVVTEEGMECFYESLYLDAGVPAVGPIALGILILSLSVIAYMKLK